MWKYCKKEMTREENVDKKFFVSIMKSAVEKFVSYFFYGQIM